MNVYIEIAIVYPVLILSYQMYSFSASGKGIERQDRCLKLGVVYMTVGICSLVPRSVPLAFFGIIMIMFAFRLLAKGLDRLDKKIFIDRYDEDS